MITKGEMKFVLHNDNDWRISIETKEHQICGIKPGKAASGLLTKEEHLANAQELVRRWNGFEALLAACEAVVKSLGCVRLNDRNMPPCNEGWRCYVCEAKAAISAANAGTTQNKDAQDGPG